jgi:chromosome condensin MukBEF complex kleisin-like MukF subunit
VVRALNLAEYMADTNDAIREFEKTIGAARDKLSARLTEARGAFLGQDATEKVRSVERDESDYARR